MVSAGFFVAWFVCAFVLGKGGYVHVLLLIAIPLAVVQLAQERRTAQR
jgi:hypothetical protein